MNSPQRAEAKAMPQACARLTRRAVAAITAAVLACFAAGGAEAMTRTTHPHPHAVAQDQEPGPSHVHPHSRKSTAGPKSKAKQEKAEKHETLSGKRTRRKSHSARPADEPQDPLPVKRASRRGQRSRVLREEASEQAARPSRGSLHPAHERRSEPEAEPLILTVHHAARRHTARKQDDELETANAQSAGTSPTPQPPAKAFAEGVARPDEFADQAALTMPAVAARPMPHVTAAQGPTIPARPQQRVEGFGAEGDVANPGRRTLARTMAAHRNDPLLTAKAPVLSGAEQNELTEEAVQPVVLPESYSHNGRIVLPAALKGSREVLVHQNLMADHDGLERIHDDAQLDELVSDHQLARLPESASLHVNPELPENRRYARPWTVKFASETARAYAARFGTPLQVNSAVRTVTYQLRLMRVNGNAAAVDGDTASPHLTGQAIDIGKRGMSKAQLAWMRSYLLPLMQAGKVDVEEEFQQACFHISVYRSYGGPAHKLQVAQVTHEPGNGD